MDITSLEEGLTFRGEVTGTRQKYYVFEAEDFYVVLSFSRSKPRSGYFNLVDRKAVKYVHDRFAGRGRVTANMVAERARRTSHAPTPLAALNILYVLVAIGAATKEGEGSHGQLRFRVLRRG